jgi:hypothetical protein
MTSLLLALFGSLVGVGAVTLLYLKWRGDLRSRAVVAVSWAAIAVSVILWAMAFPPDVGAAFAVLVMILMALGLLLRGVDLRALAQFPGARRTADPAPARRTTWSGVAARVLAVVAAAPAVGMSLGLLVWSGTPAHESTRFVLAVFSFLLAFAALLIWSLSAVRPWRALGLILVLGAAASVPVLVVS